MKSETIMNSIKASSTAITLVSVLFYFWGYYLQAFWASSKGIPMEFIPERSIQAYMLKGGFVGVFIILPLFAILYGIGIAIDNWSRGKVSRFVFAIRRQGAFVEGLCLILLLSLSIVLLQPISTLLSKESQPSRLTVQKISLKQASDSATNYVGLCYVSTKGSNYVFADTLAHGKAHIYLLQESEVRQIVFDATNGSD